MRHKFRIAVMGGGVRLAALVLAAGFMMVPVEAIAHEPSHWEWLEKLVVPKSRDCKFLNRQDRMIDDGMFPYHVVLEVKGPSLQIKTSGGDAWVAVDQIVRIDKAITFFSEAIRANPRDPFNYFMRAEVLLNESKAPDKALADFNEAIRLDPKDARSYRGRAEVWSVKKDWDKVIADCDEAIRLDPKDAASYLCRSDSWGAKNDFDKALADANEAIRLDPKDEVTFDLRGTILLNRHEYDRAIADYKEAIRLDHCQVHGSAGRVASGGENPKTDLASDIINRLTRRQPEPAPGPADDLEGFCLNERSLAWAYVARGADWHHRGEYDKAIADGNEAIRLYPKGDAGYLVRGLAWKDKEENDKALADFDEAIRIDPRDTDAYTCRSMVWTEKGQYDKALADCTEAIRRDPQQALAYVVRGVVREYKGEKDKTLADFDEAIRVDPKDASTYAWRGCIWIKRKAYDKALADFDEAIRIDPKQAGAYCWRGEVWTRKREYDKALVEYDRALQINPQSKAGYAGRAWVWATAVDAKYRDGRKAVAAATTACERWGWKNPYALDTLAAAGAEAGDFEAAVKWETRAIELETDQEDKADYSARLALYREKKPYRDAKP